MFLSFGLVFLCLYGCLVSGLQLLVDVVRIGSSRGIRRLWRWRFTLHGSLLGGKLFGISFIHKKEHFCRAVLEGVAFSIKDCSSIFEELGLKLDDLKDDLRIIGGGSKSKLWRQMNCWCF